MAAAVDLARQKLDQNRELRSSFSQLAPVQLPAPPDPVDAASGGPSPEAEGGDNSGIFADIVKRFGLRQSGGDRTEESNRAAGGVKNSYHLRKGWAGDFVGSAKSMQDALVYARQNKNTVEALVHNAGSGQHLHWAVKPGGGARLVAGPAPQANGTGRVGQVSGLSPAEAWIIQRESGGNPQAFNKTVVYDRGKRLGNAWGIGQIVDDRPISQRPQTVQEQLAVFRNYVAKRYGTAEKAQSFWQKNHWY